MKRNSILSTIFWGILIFGCIGFLGYLFFIASANLSQLVPKSLAWGLVVLGSSLFLIGKIFLRKKFVYKSEPNKVTLSTPFWVDLTYLFGSLFILLGLSLNRDISQILINITWFAIISYVAFLIWICILIFRLGFALNDKIIVEASQLILDDTTSKRRQTVLKSDIDEVLFLKTFEYQKIDYDADNYEFSLTITLKSTDSDTPKVIDVDAYGMNLKLEYVVDALKEMGYEVTLKSKKDLETEIWEGHDLKD